MCLPTTLVLPRASILGNPSKIMAGQPPSHHTLILPNQLLNLNMPPTINVPRYLAPPSINIPSSSSSSHDRTAGGHLRRQASIHLRPTILPVKVLPLK